MYYIYKIMNNISNKIYIGQTQNLKARLKNHFGKLRRNQHGNPYLQEDYNKYGLNNFKWEILEELEDFNQVLIKEDYWIDYYGGIESDNLYNCKNNKNNNKSMKVKVRKNAKENPNFGMKNKHLSKETKYKLSLQHIGTKSSKETCEKISKANKRYSIEFINELRQEYLKVNSYVLISKKYNINPCSVSRLIKYGTTNLDKIYNKV